MLRQLSRSLPFEQNRRHLAILSHVGERHIWSLSRSLTALCTQSHRPRRNLLFPSKQFYPFYPSCCFNYCQCLLLFSTLHCIFTSARRPEPEITQGHKGEAEPLRVCLLGQVFGAEIYSGCSQATLHLCTLSRSSKSYLCLSRSPLIKEMAVSCKTLPHHTCLEHGLLPALPFAHQSGHGSTLVLFII